MHAAANRVLETADHSSHVLFRGSVDRDRLQGEVLAALQVDEDALSDVVATTVKTLDTRTRGEDDVASAVLGTSVNYLGAKQTQMWLTMYMCMPRLPIPPRRSNVPRRSCLSSVWG